MSDKINVLICEPLTAPYMKEIDSSLESLQATVGGGLIQAIYPFEDQVALVCNEEGKINGMTLNRAVYGDEGLRVGSTAGMLYQGGSNILQPDISSRDSLVIRLYHLMPDEMLEGVHDIGVKLVSID